MNNVLHDNVKIDSNDKFVNGYFWEYVREIQANKIIPTVILVKFITSTNVDSLSEEAYIQVDDKTIATKVAELTALAQSETQVKSSTAKVLDIKEGGFKDETEVKSTTYQYNILSGKLELTKEIEDLILNSKKLTFRFYAFKDPITVNVTESELNLIKKFLKTTEADSKS